MRKVYINLGCGDGIVTKEFLEENPDYEAYGFDPLPMFDKELAEIEEKYNFKYSRKAAWISNEKKTLYACGRGGVCSSLMREKFATRFSNPDVWKRRVREHDIECFHFSQWFEDNFSSEDYIVVYMDIEISEFYILNDMIERDLLSYIDNLTVEFHKQPARTRKWVYSEALKDETRNLYEKIITYIDENFRTKTRLGRWKSNTGGFWRWEK